MKAVVLYHPKSEHEYAVTQYQRDFKQAKGRDLELLSLETLEGAETARLYGISTYPALLVIADDGQLQKFWQGTPLPLMDELDGYLRA